MKIGIFGDSFADCSWASHFQSGPGWPELLADQYNVTNHALAGTGLYYSYEQFCKHHKNYDRIIFVSSCVDRFSVYLPNADKIFHIVPGAWNHSALIKNLNKNDLRILNAVENYVLYVLDPERELTFGKLMIDNICRMRNDVIILPAFPIKDNLTTPLHLISVMEEQYYNLSKINLNNLTDIRKCHLTDENNLMVYKKLITAIDENRNSINIDTTDFKIPLREQCMYWKVINS
jgi:hypothetical protein